jgi:hypothetical protein
MLQSRKLFCPSFSETGHPSRENTTGTAEDEAMDEFVEVADSDTMSRLVLM